MYSPNHLSPRLNQRQLVEASPATVGWKYLSFEVLHLAPGESEARHSGALEQALVPLNGVLKVEVGQQTFNLTRKSVFTDIPDVLYLPPGTAYRITALTDSQLALGGAPAEGRYPLTLFPAHEVKVEMRGGANATRQVSHILGPHRQAERLLLYEVYTPSGFWSGWPPHRHDGQLGSLYIEETYYYRIDPLHGWALHHNYSPEHFLDEVLRARNGDLILSPHGYHPVAAPPGSNVYYLNYMAGEALNEERAIPPVDDPHWSWMRQDWTGRPMRLPLEPEAL
jgi:5-deoxy-glucuronate isomerase